MVVMLTGLSSFAQGSGPIFLVSQKHNSLSITKSALANHTPKLIQTMVNEYCAGDSLERKFILGTTNSIA